ncbi:acyltransferase [Mucilaginibacter jinjuensis]|uniref:Acyltransferase n=1 Tax=Mucilaginibacter jinjuensis TaxID=1176721 RepID=A0ABY7T6Y2_9SPHI|nr:acyltransferase [Mucilaginibacter jinjuensis]WCT11875.1 acyltransferase [Mucilaginibacter jinjuensis]
MVKILRLIVRICFYIANAYRKFFLRMMYPGLKIDGQSIIEKNCKIVCVDGGKMIIKNTHISIGVHLFADVGATISIENSSVGRYSVIASKQSITIEKGVAIAEMVVIRDQDHAIDVNNAEAGFSQYTTGPVHIEKNVWIASKATILKGVTIGNDSIIAASAVVTKPVPANEVWGGVPARFIKKVRI